MCNTLLHTAYMYVCMYVCTYVFVYVRTVRMSHNAVALLHTRLAMPSKCTENSKHLMGRMSNWARYGCTHICTYECRYVCVYVRTCQAVAERETHETDRYKEGEGVNQITVQDGGGVVQVCACM